MPFAADSGSVHVQERQTPGARPRPPERFHYVMIPRLGVGMNSTDSDTRAQ